MNGSGGSGWVETGKLREADSGGSGLRQERRGLLTIGLGAISGHPVHCVATTELLLVASTSRVVTEKSVGGPWGREQVLRDCRRILGARRWLRALCVSQKGGRDSKSHGLLNQNTRLSWRRATRWRRDGEQTAGPSKRLAISN